MLNEERLSRIRKLKAENRELKKLYPKHEKSLDITHNSLKQLEKAIMNDIELEKEDYSNEK